MKRIVCAMLALLVCLVAAGCGQDGGVNQAGTPAQPEQTVAPQQTAQPTAAPEQTTQPAATPQQQGEALPADEFLGTWQDTVSQRCGMKIQIDGTKYVIEINWGSSARENTRWSFTGQYDSARGGIAYTGQRVEEVYPEEGKVEETVVYENGTGLLYLKEGLLYWTDDVEDMGAQCVFEKYEG